MRLFDGFSTRERLRILRYLADKLGLTAELGGGGARRRERSPGAVVRYTSSLGTSEEVDVEAFDASLDEAEDRSRTRGRRDDLAGDNYFPVDD